MINSCAAIVIAAKHGELIKVKDASGIAYTVGTLRCKFEFRTSDWDYTTRTAVFCKGNMATHPGIVDTAIGVLLDNVDECAVPPEVLLPDEKYFSVGVWGVTKEGLRIVSKWLVFRIEDGCYVDSSESISPTPTVYEQIIAELSQKAPIEHDHEDRYYSRDDIDEKLKNITLGDVVTPENIPTKVSQLINDSNFISSIPDEYITEDELSAKGYLTEIPNLDKLENDVDKLQKDKVDKSNLEQIVNNTLAQAKASGEFDGADGKDGLDGYTPVKGEDYYTEAEKQELIDEIERTVTGGGGSIVVDQTYNSTSENAQSGKAVAEALIDYPKKDGVIPTPTTANVGQTIVVKEIDESGKPTAWEAVDVGTGAKKWDLLGEYTFTEDNPIGAITLTDLPQYTEFMIYVRYLYTSVATADISFYINNNRISGFNNSDNNVGRIHLKLNDCWHMAKTQIRTANAVTAVEANNSRSDTSESNTATKLVIKNHYGAATFKKGSMVIYGAK